MVDNRNPNPFEANDPTNFNWNTYDTTFKGLQNNQGRNNCFLNVVIQSLWHLASFRSEFLNCE